MGVSLYVNGTPSGVDCIIPGGSTTCSDTVSTITVAAGDLVTIEVLSLDAATPHVHASFSISGSAPVVN